MVFLSICGIMWSVHRLGYNNGKDEERMRVLDILCKIPPMSSLISDSSAKYDIQYNTLYVIDHILTKLMEER